MKFGLEFHQHLLAKWADDYVDYNGLRRMIRLAQLASQREESLIGTAKFCIHACLSLTNFYPVALKSLERSIESFETSHQKKFMSIIQREADLCAIIGLPSMPVAIPDIYTVEQSELSAILFIYKGLLQELNEVEWFDRVNETAITKIFGKFGNGFQQMYDYQRLQLQWSIMQQTIETPRVTAQKRISGLMVDISRICAMTRKPTRSLYVSECTRVDRALDNSYDWIKHDRVDALKEYCLSLNRPRFTEKARLKRHFHVLFVAAVMMEANECTQFLLAFVTKENWVMRIDHMFLFLGFCGAMKETGTQATPTPEDWLIKMLDGPRDLTTTLLRSGDDRGRLVLHYAAKYGLKSFCEALIRCAMDFESEHLAEMLSRRDDEGMTPLHYAALSRETSVLVILLKGLIECIHRKQSKINLGSLLRDILFLSVRTGQDDIVKAFLHHQPDLNYTSLRGETALYCAAQANNVDLVKFLLTCVQRGLDANIATAAGWTPLMVSCANGYNDVVSCLLEAGVETESCDALGWTAREHAVFRGHLGIAMLFTPPVSESINGGPASSHDWVAHRVAYKSPPQTSFSDSSKRLVVVNLGSTQGGHGRAAFELSHYHSERSSDTEATSSLVLEISAPGTSADAKVVRLPVLEDQINQPFIFQAKNEAALQISVRLFRRESIDSMVLLSRGNTTLDHGKVFFGNKRESMIREVTVFMMDKDTMDLTGTVLLSYVVVTPFAGLQQPGTANYRRRLEDPMRIFGHRGTCSKIVLWLSSLLH